MDNVECKICLYVGPEEEFAEYDDICHLCNGTSNKIMHNDVEIHDQQFDVEKIHDELDELDHK